MFSKTKFDFLERINGVVLEETTSLNIFIIIFVNSYPNLAQKLKSLL